MNSFKRIGLQLKSLFSQGFPEKIAPWWQSFPSGLRVPSHLALAGDVPDYAVGEIVRLNNGSLRNRKVLQVEWHENRRQWIYIVETHSSDQGLSFQPYFFADKLRKAG